MGKKILIFDDDSATLEVVSIICQDLGYSVETSETADNIISKVEMFLPNLIMMDINIPLIGGIEATRLIKTHHTYSKIPVVFITAKNNVAKLSSQAHADGYLAKPFDIEELEGIVDQLLG